MSPSLPTPHKIEDVVFKEEGSLDFVNPVVKCNLSLDEINDINGYNYMYFPQLKSYYWITIHTEGMILVIEGERDPFNTFWDSIKKSVQYVTRNEHKINRMIPDNRLVIHSDNKYDLVHFGNDVFDKHCTHVILETVGTGSKGSD